MKKVTDYVKVGELCEAPDGTILKCVKTNSTRFNSSACCGCYLENKHCRSCICDSTDRDDYNSVYFEKVDQ